MTHIVSGQHTNISEPVTQDERVCLDPEDPKDLPLQLRNQRGRCESNKLLKRHRPIRIVSCNYLRMRKAVAASPASRMEMPCMYVRTHQPQLNYTHTREAEAVRRWHRRRPSVQPTARSWWLQPRARRALDASSPSMYVVVVARARVARLPRPRGACQPGRAGGHRRQHDSAQSPLLVSGVHGIYALARRVR